MQEIQETFNALDALLKDEKTFSEVVSAVFASIDKDGSGTLEIEEVEEFIMNVCSEMGIKNAPAKSNIRDVFEELDEDKSKNISKDELAKFLTVLFEEQRNQLGKQLKSGGAIGIAAIALFSESSCILL